MNAMTTLRRQKTKRRLRRCHHSFGVEAQRKPSVFSAIKEVAYRSPPGIIYLAVISALVSVHVAH
jgi:hypothetical protein